MEDRPECVPSSGGLELSAADPPAVAIDNSAGRSPFLLLGDHAGNAIPRLLGDLGLDAKEMGRHIALDIGVRELGAGLADALDAVFIHQPYSRLVIDCNRAPYSPQSIVETSDGTRVPANVGLDGNAAGARIAAVHEPYHRAIAAEIARRRGEGIETILVSLHSFTPALAGVARPWQIGLLHDKGETGFSYRLLGQLRRVSGLCVGDNEPYQMDGTDYTVPLHAYSGGLAYAEIEIRQDLLSDAEGVRRWCGILNDALAVAAIA